MIRNEAYWIGIIAKELSEEATAEERRELAEWVSSDEENQILYNELKMLWEKTTLHEMPEFRDSEQSWDRIDQAINTLPRVQPFYRRKLFRVAVASAAVVLLGIFAWQLIRQNDMALTPPAMVEVQADDRKRVDLPDGSVVWLNDGSSLSYIAGFSKREVRLRGEGFFEVAEDPVRPFSVLVRNARAVVLGTKFTLKEYKNGQVELLVTEGKVAFSHTGNASVTEVLTRRQAARIDPVTQLPVRVTEPLEDVNRLSWRTGTLTFNHESLEIVIRDIERHFQVDLQVTEPGMLDCELKADFSNASLEEVLETIEFSLKSTITKDNSVYRISGKPCNTPVE